jgi:uncharacterized membrane protein
MSNETNSNAGAQGGMDGKTIAIISYITFIGWIVSYVMYSNNKSQLAIYHIRQTLGLFITGFALYIVMFIFLFIPILGWIISIIIWVCLVALFVLWIFGLVSAINGQEKPVPVIGETIQKILAGVK